MSQRLVHMTIPPLGSPARPPEGTRPHGGTLATRPEQIGGQIPSSLVGHASTYNLKCTPAILTADEKMGDQR